jgi:hypothetical protein
MFETSMSSPKCNRLAQSHSPYLLQHQHNPVDWFPWCDEAFEKAKQTGRPVFLSVGYAACHWCHVMERESFENETIATYLNEHFVSIKVDREERPDIDQVYMNAVQVMSGRGGWPMSVFLNHDRVPFYAGTYWPPQARFGMPSFPQVLTALVEAWRDRRTDVESHAIEIREALDSVAGETPEDTEFTRLTTESSRWISGATSRLLQLLDRRLGGFGNAPKFPHATDLELLLTRGVTTQAPELIEAAVLTLDKIAAGGIHDHVGGGFARYSVDERWLVPHFEKMLYDNALLARQYTRAFQITGDSRHANVVRRTLNYITRELTDESGGFHCSEDADSEGVEGKFYVWRPTEVQACLGAADAELFCRVYDITHEGNFEGHSIPNLLSGISVTPEDRQTLDRCLDKLYETRKMRIPPGRDDKVLTSWNALAISSLALAGSVLNVRSWIDAAQRAGQFIVREMRDGSLRLRHAFRAGTAHIDGFLEDYAFTLQAFIDLYEATADESWIEQSIELAEQLLTRFQSPRGGFYFTANDAPALITRMKDWHDGSLVSGNGSAIHGLLRLGDLCDRKDFVEAAKRALCAGSHAMETQAGACAALLMGMERAQTPQVQWVFAISNDSQLTQWRPKFFANYEPYLTRAWASEQRRLPQLEPILRHKASMGGEPALYVCRQFVCDPPVAGESASDFLQR